MPRSQPLPLVLSFAHTIASESRVRWNAARRCRRRRLRSRSVLLVFDEEEVSNSFLAAVTVAATNTKIERK